MPLPTKFLIVLSLERGANLLLAAHKAFVLSRYIILTMGEF